MKKINVIIPNYNYGKYLEMCLMSVYTQKTDSEIEILVLDDCSTDYSLEILSRLKNSFHIPGIKLNFFQNQSNIGEVETTKLLLDKCDGDYIAYIDADDYWIDPNKLQKQYDFLEKNKEYSLSYTGYLILRDDKYEPHAKGDFFLGPPLGFDPEKELNTNYITNNHNCIFSSSRFFRNYGDLSQEYFNHFSGSDWPLNFELSLRGKINYISYPSYVYRIHPGSLSRTPTDGVNYDSWYQDNDNAFNLRINKFNQDKK